jgi:hypothetical protein
VFTSLFAWSVLVSYLRVTQPASDRIVKQLRLSAWARVFRRLQRSVELTEPQRAAILRRQIALGIRSTLPQGQASRKSTSAVSPASSGHVDSDSDGDSGKRAAHHVKAAKASVSSAAGPASLPAPSVVSAPLSFIDVQNDVDFVQYESADSGDEHRPQPEGTLVVKVRVVISRLVVCCCASCDRCLLQDAWFSVLHPELEAALLPALLLMGSKPIGFEEFCTELDEHRDHSRPAPQLYLLTKVLALIVPCSLCWSGLRHASVCLCAMM